MEAESTALAEQREITYHGEKKRADTELEFYSWFSVVVLTCWVAFEPSPKNGAHKLLSPYIFMANVQLGVFTSSRLASTLQKPCHPLPSICCWREDHPLPLVPYMLRRFWDLQFFLVIFNYNKRLGLTWLFGDWLLFYSFIHLFYFFFNFNFLWAVQLHYSLGHQPSSVRCWFWHCYLCIKWGFTFWSDWNTKKNYASRIKLFIRVTM